MGKKGILSWPVDFKGEPLEKRGVAGQLGSLSSRDADFDPW